METIRKRFGERVRRLRKAKGLSQEELAFRAGVHRTYLGGIERGERNLPGDLESKFNSGGLSVSRRCL